MSVKDDLFNYYTTKSKHSNYQVLPRRLRALLSSDEVQTKTRYELERLDYILEKITINNKTVLDIGGNTGFFTFELIEAGAKSTHCYEGNKEHADFVRLAAKALDLQNVRVTNRYFSFEDDVAERYDVILLLNVLHHIGDDYGDDALSMEAALKNIIRQLNSLADKTETLVFQMGFNWQGNINQNLFQHGTKQEMIDFIKDGIKNTWEIIAIGIPERTESGVKYMDLNNKNIARDDSLGEFLNRPLFIFRTKAR